MKFNRSIGLVGTAFALFIVGCSSGDSSGGGGSGGGSATATSATGTTSASTTSTTASTTSSTGTGAPACISCSDLAGKKGTPDQLCTKGSPSSADLWTTLQTCVCAKACPMECGESLCKGMAPSDPCQTCLADTGGIVAACPAEANACIGDQ